MPNPNTETNPPSPGRDDVDVPVANPNDLDNYVYTAAFDISCSQKAHERARALAAEESDVSDEDNSLWSGSGNDSTAATDPDSSSHDVSKLEAYFYHAGIAPRGHWPKLVFRDGDDIFEVPKGPDTRVRHMRLANVPETHEFASNGLWEQVRDWIADFLIRNGVKVSSVDFVRFVYEKKIEDREIESDEEEEDDEEEKEEEGATDEEEDLDAAFEAIALSKPVKDRNDQYHYTNATVWIGVLPDTMNGTRAHELTKEIRTFLDGLHFDAKVDIAFRESMAKSLVANGPKLYAPVDSGDPLQDVVDNVSVALSIPISGRKTTMQGTMGPYFHHDGKLYAITARHNLFLANDGNAEYKYKTSAPKNKVIVMGTLAFNGYMDSIKASIGNLNESVKTLKIKIGSLEERLANGQAAPGAQELLKEQQNELERIERKVLNLKRFHVVMGKKWAKTGDRVIGHVVYAPPIGVGVGPNRFTRDFCIVELDKSKFVNFIGNFLSLGPEYKPEDLTKLLYERIDVSSEFKYPTDGLLKLWGMLTADDIKNPNTLDTHEDRIRRVVKRGFKTNTTVGTLSGFISYVRNYFPNDTTTESLELSILPHESETGTFSKGGDSGALIVSPKGEFVGLLTGGTNKGTDGSDITYATLFKYVWDNVLEKYPGASLYWENIQAFLAGAA